MGGLSFGGVTASDVTVGRLEPIFVAVFLSLLHFVAAFLTVLQGPAHLPGGGAV